MPRFACLPRRFAFVASLAWLGATAFAAEPSIPPEAPNCALAEPPEAAGAYVSPGGFLLVYPRNAELANNYTGCKSIWVARAPNSMPLLMRLYFSDGALAFAQAYDGHGEPRKICTLPVVDPACDGIQDNPLAALRLPTWPRSCLQSADDPACSADPE